MKKEWCEIPFYSLFFWFGLVFQGSISLCSLSCSGIPLCRPDQAGLKLTDLPATPSDVLALKVCATTTQTLYYSLETTFFPLQATCYLISFSYLFQN